MTNIAKLVVDLTKKQVNHPEGRFRVTLLLWGSARLLQIGVVGAWCGVCHALLEVELVEGVPSL